MAQPPESTDASDLDGASFVMIATAVLAMGGNALVKTGETGTHAQQQRNAEDMARAVVGVLASDYQVVITHGNGPQIGNLAIQNEEGAGLVPSQPLSVMGGMTQGQIGHLLALALDNVTGSSASVVSIVTHVLVDASDHALGSPTKPIGPFFEHEQARTLARERGWDMAEDAGRGLRRVVPSPGPKAIIEADAIRTLVESGFVVIAAGGGGIPVVANEEGLVGIDAVIDKDLSAERLAAAIGARALLLLTGVDRVALDFGTENERPLTTLAVAEAERFLADGHFPTGSMGPKVRAAIRFIESGGEIAIITSPARAADALAGRHGTRIVASVESRAVPG